MDLTEGTLLGGRLRYDQPKDGWRTGIEPVLLAAAIPARPGDRVLEAGTGAGAGLLCLMARVPGLLAAGIEHDPAMTALARANLAANAMTATIHEADVATAPDLGPVDHAFANPPWHDPAGTPPAGARRILAKQRDGKGLAAWIGPLSAALGSRGTLTLVLPATMAAETCALLLDRGLGRITLCPLWPRTGAAAKLLLVQARLGQPDTRIAPGLVLHKAEGGYTAAADALLRGPEALPMELAAAFP